MKPFKALALVCLGLILLTGCGLSQGQTLPEQTTAAESLQPVNPQGDWFVSYYNDRLSTAGETLSPVQQAYIQSTAKDLGLRQTSDGYTIEVVSVLTDGYSAYLGLRITAPEYTKLSATLYYLQGEPLCTLPEDVTLTGQETSLNHQVHRVHPHSQGRSYTYDPGNVMDMIVQLPACQTQDGSAPYAGGRTYRLNIDAIGASFYHNVGGHAMAETMDFQVVEGPWTFEISFDEQPQEALELIRRPISCQASLGTYESLGENVYSVKLTSFRLYPLTAFFQWEPEGEDLGQTPLFYNTQAVMKDGSQVVLNATESSGPFRCAFPLVLDQVDHILLPDGTKLQAEGQDWQTQPRQDADQIPETTAATDPPEDPDLVQCREALAPFQNQDCYYIRSDNEFWGESPMNSTSQVSYLKSGSDWLHVVRVPQEETPEGAGDIVQASLCLDGKFYSGYQDQDQVMHWEEVASLEPIVPWIAAFDLDDPSVHLAAGSADADDYTLDFEVLSPYPVREGCTADGYYWVSFQFDHYDRFLQTQMTYNYTDEEGKYTTVYQRFSLAETDPEIISRQIREFFSGNIAN